MSTPMDALYFVRQVWVSKHVKGPPDKPLVVRDSVTALVR